MHGADHNGRPGCAGRADHALRVIAAERHAAYVLEQVRLGKLSADDLALELGSAYGLTLQALARSIVKAIEETGSVRP